MSKHSLIQNMCYGLTTLARVSRNRFNRASLISFILLFAFGTIYGIFSSAEQVHQAKKVQHRTVTAQSNKVNNIIIKGNSGVPHGDRSHTDHMPPLNDNSDDEEDSDTDTYQIMYGTLHYEHIILRDKQQPKVSFISQIPLYIIFHAWKHFLP